MKGFKRLLLTTSILAAGAAIAGDKPDNTEFNIDSQGVSTALKEFAAQANLKLLHLSDSTENLVTPALKGSYTMVEALEILISGTNLEYEFVSDDTVAIRAAKDGETDEAEGDEKASDENKVDEEIIVTGSRIARPASQITSNIIVLDARDLQASGEATLEGALRQLPQNILGATPTGAGIVNSGMSFNGALNITGASSINLRGFGGESTLVLVDGRRIGKSGVFGGISDITGIPLRMVERVEIKLDGGSSVYGSDAVGGVVNIITKKDFEGGEVHYEYAAPEQGGFEENVFTVTATESWGSGRIQGTFERYKSTNLDSGERPEQIAPFDFYSDPGRFGLGSNIFDFFFRDGDQVLTLSELLAIYPDAFSRIFTEFPLQYPYLPPDQDGMGLTLDDLVFRGDESRPVGTRVSAGTSIQPKRVNNVLSLYFDQKMQLLGSEVELSGSLYYSEGKLYAATGAFTFVGLALADDPDNPFGSQRTVNWKIYDFADKHYQTDQEKIRWNLSLTGDLGKDWRWRADLGQSRDSGKTLRFNEAINIYEVGAGFTISQEYQALIDDGLNIFAGDLRAANSPELMQRLISPPLDTVSVNTESVFDIVADGTLFNLPGGDAHMLIGANWRQEGLESGSRNRIAQRSDDPRELGSPGNVLAGSVPMREFDDVDLNRAQRAFFTELSIPVVGVDNAMPGIKGLYLTGKARYDTYQRQGSDSTWSLGLAWSPLDQARFRVEKSTSFAVPNFRYEIEPTVVTDYTENPRYPMGLPYPLLDADGNPTGELDYQRISISGGISNLRPETASIMSAGVTITPDALPGFSVSVDWRDTQYINRVGSPPRVFELDLTQSGLGFGSFYADSGYDTKYGRTLYRGEDGLLVWDRRPVNIARWEESGLDYRISYNTETDYGNFHVNFNVAHTNKLNTIQQAGDEPINHVDHVEFNSKSPIPAYSYRTQLHWEYNGLSTTLNVSKRSNTSSLGALGRATVQRITKYPLNMALTVTYDVDEGDLFAVPAWFQGTVIKLSIPRLLDETTESETINLTRNEPIYELNANTADSIGRMFRIGLTKRF